MTNKSNRNGIVSKSLDLDSLYVEFLQRFYHDADRVRANEIAAHLERALADFPDFAESIRGEEVRSLIAELHGDTDKAIRSREAEIRKILELHTLATNTPSWASVARQYDFSDVSDRLDLLAILYDRHGDKERALATLRESQQYCTAHAILFDGQELLDELGGSRGDSRRNGAPRRKRKARPKAAKRA